MPAANTLRSFLSRISHFLSSKDTGESGQPLQQPSGYEPIQASLAGVMYGDRSRKVLCCSLREKVWLRRQPDNLNDSNAIEIINQRGQQIGYIERQLAAKLAPYMDAGRNPIEAVITALASDVPGEKIGAKVGFYVPSELLKRIRPERPHVEYYCDEGSSGTLYLFLECDEATLKQVTGKLAEAGLAWSRYGISYRPAGNGRQYEWYVVLEDDVTQERIEQFFRDYFGVAPPREQAEPSLQEYIDAFDPEKEELRRDNARLSSENDALRKELEECRDAQQRSVETGLSRDSERRRRRKGKIQKDEFPKVIQVLLPRIEFLRDSMGVMAIELKDPYRCCGNCTRSTSTQTLIITLRRREFNLLLGGEKNTLAQGPVTTGASTSGVMETKSGCWFRAKMRREEMLSIFREASAPKSHLCLALASMSQCGALRVHCAQVKPACHPRLP